MPCACKAHKPCKSYCHLFYVCNCIAITTARLNCKIHYDDSLRHWVFTQTQQNWLKPPSSQKNHKTCFDEICQQTRWWLATHLTKPICGEINKNIQNIYVVTGSSPSTMCCKALESQIPAELHFSSDSHHSDHWQIWQQWCCLYRMDREEACSAAGIRWWSSPHTADVGTCWASPEQQRTYFAAIIWSTLCMHTGLVSLTE